MIEINIAFQEEYKRLDKLCKDLFNSPDGVSTYIREMENAPNYINVIDNWETTYRQLKHLRWKRNQLAHEVSIDSYFCEQNDVEWIRQFYAQILNSKDPLAIARIIKQRESKSRETTEAVAKHNKSRQTLWDKIVSKIKSWFL